MLLKKENRFIGFLMTTLVQLPGYIFVLATLERPEFGRKKSLVAFLIITGICLFCHPLVPATSKYWQVEADGKGKSYTFRYLSRNPSFLQGISSSLHIYFGKILCKLLLHSFRPLFIWIVSNSGTKHWHGFYNCCQQSRNNSGYFFSKFLILCQARNSFFSAPYLLLLNNYAPLVLGVSSFTAGTLALMLPETLGQGLPETIEDGEKIELVYPTFLSRKGRWFYTFTLS